MAIFDISYVGEMPYLKLTGGIVTGATTFNDNLAVSTINGVTVGSDPKFTDTTYSVATTSANGLLSSTDKAAVNKIGSGSLNTTNKTLIGAVNELKSGVDSCKSTWVTGTKSAARSDNISSNTNIVVSVNVPAKSYITFYMSWDASSASLGYGYPTSAGVTTICNSGMSGAGAGGSSEHISYGTYTTYGFGLLFVSEGGTINLRYAHNISTAQTITYGYCVWS